MQALLEKTNEVPLYKDVLTVLGQPLYQSIIKVVSGKSKSGFVLFDSNSNKIDEVLSLCQRLEIPNEKIKVIDPTKSWTLKFQPFKGALNSAGDLLQTMEVLLSNNNEFFKSQQSTHIFSITLLSIISFGQKTTINHIIQLFLDTRYLADIVEELRERYNNKDQRIFNSNQIKTVQDLLDYFEQDVLDYQATEAGEVSYPDEHRYAGRQIVKNKKDRYITGVKNLFDEFSNNPLMSNLFNYDDGKEIFDTGLFIKEGGVLLVNSATSETENKQTPFFGQLFLTHFQNAVTQYTKECVQAGVRSTPIIFYPCKVL
ncbi:hypothetical protein [Lysinibacillus irui]|uniref:Uncharacterized protein n=1 Tax=Lysinibacillus irui TaxID=2998077 RepID=A0AAJ5UW80_9BACI|nr:hypothetical protein [Lysinibacillus irui]WDV09193.1 hypothetical protein OU989_23180 [Lysinibacillus irui]